MTDVDKSSLDGNRDNVLHGEAATTSPSQAKSQHEHDASGSSKNWQFYLTLVSLSFITFVSSLDGSIIAIALPEITNKLSAADDYLCNIFGRRTPMIIVIGIFALGSGLAGGATSSGFLIAGRTVQGLGSGGIFMLVELIVCDIVPLRERGKYLGYVMSSNAIGAVIGPVIGGALATANWRWIFYMNLPISGVVMVIMIIALRLRHEKPATWTQAISRIDWIGNALFVTSLCSVLLGLVFGGTVFPCSSWRVILPITCGTVGWACFHMYEWKPPGFCKEVSVAPRIFANRTSAAGFYIDFVSSMLLQWVCFFWPVYFQGTKGTSPLKAGVYFIPFEAFLILIAASGGGILTKFGYYRPLHLLGFALSVLGPGLNIMLSETTPKVAWVFFMIIDAVGRGLLLPTVLPAIMAALPESDVASATGMFSFLRSFGFIWGVTIPGIISNSQFDRLSVRISDPTVRQELSAGRAYQSVSGAYVQSLELTSAAEVISVYIEALRAVWIAAVAFGATGFIAEKHVALRTELDTKYGLEHGGENDQEK